MSSDRSFVSHLHELLAYFNARGVITILVSAQHGFLDAEQTRFEATYLADLVILLRYFEAQGSIRQAISVVKNRGSKRTEEMPMTEKASSTVYQTRMEIGDILRGKDHRLLVIAGPCSIHDTKAAREYAAVLKTAIDDLSADLRIVMRVYFEKPRTTIGWKGLINDPHLDQSFKINDGLRLARRLLLDLAETGVPAGTEFLDMIIPQYMASLVSWGAIGARTTESQVHRELVSGLSCPVGFKNGTSGDVQIAIEAVRSAAHPHTFLGRTKHGQSAIFVTLGNPDCHMILRGGRTTTNYDSASVAQACALLQNAGLSPLVMIDCSHANSSKDHTRQSLVCRDVIGQIATGDRRIIGVMLESNLVAGAQKLLDGKPVVYGQSITDACIGWDETLELLRELAMAVRSARRHEEKDTISRFDGHVKGTIS